ncbi:MAG: hypothetical protein ACI8QZ_002976 [Chlamydiales bacterium]
MSPPLPPPSVMSNKQLGIAALAAIVLTLLGFLAFKDSVSPTLVAPLAALPGPAHSTTDDLLGEPDSATAMLEGVAPIPENESGAARSSASDELTYAPTDGRWIVGQVIFPDGVEAGDDLQVFALAREVGYSSFVGQTGAHDLAPDDPSEAMPDATKGESDAGVIRSQAPVDADGNFRIAVDEGEDTYLMLRGRYLYLPATRHVAIDDRATIKLEAVAGACVAFHALTPDGSPLGDAKFKFDTTLEGSDFNPLALTNGKQLRLAVRGALHGEPLEVRAIPVGANYDLLLLPESWAVQKRSIEGLVALETRRIELPLTRGGRISGVVVDLAGAPIAEAKVSASLPGVAFGFGGQAVRSTTTATDGTFTLDAVCALPVSLRAVHEEHLDSKNLRIETGEGEHIQGISLTLEDGATLTGSISHPDGTRAAGVNVKASFDQAFLAGASAFNALRGASGHAETDSNGQFTITGLGGGPFVVACETDGPAGTQWTAQRDNVAAGADHVDLVLHPPIGLWGRVTTSDGSPLESFEIKASRQVESAMGSLALDTKDTSVSEAEDGAFFLENMLEGSWHVSAIAEGYRSLEPTMIELPADTEHEPLVVVVTRTATFAGHVVGPDGERVAGATVAVDTGKPNWMAQISRSLTLPKAISEEDGSFILEGVPPGAVALFASAEGFARGASVSMDVAPGERVDDLELRMILGGRLTGEVYDEKGELAPGMMVMANSMSMNQNITSTDANGHFELNGMDPGSYQVIAMDRSADMSGMDDGNMSGLMNSMKISQADIKDGEETHITIGAPPANPVNIHGRVTHGGEPFGNAMVTFYPSGEKLYEHLKFTDVDAQGEYEIVVDGPGDYVAIVQRIGSAPGQQQNIEFSRDIPETADYRLNFELPLGRISGLVLGPDRQPRAGARITLSPAGGIRSDALLGGQYAEIQTGADGKYDLPALRPGTYTVSAGGAAFFNAGGIASLGRMTQEVKVREEQWLEHVDFALAAPGSIEVTVTDATGAAVGGAYIFVRNAEGQITEPFSLAQTGGSGRFEQQGLAPGEYTVTARKAGLVSMESEPIRVAADTRSKLTTRVEEGSILWLRIRDKEGPKRASIRVVDSTGREWGGMFGMEDLQVLYLDGGFSPTEHRIGPLPPGKYRVYAESDGLSASKPVTLRGNEERKLTVRLK